MTTVPSASTGANAATIPVAGVARAGSTSSMVSDPSVPTPSGGPAMDASAANVPQAMPATSFKVLGAISVAHMMNDMIQSILLAIYPMLKDSFDLSFAQIGM